MMGMGMSMSMMMGKSGTKAASGGGSRQRNLGKKGNNIQEKKSDELDTFPPGSLGDFFGGNPTTAQIASISSAAAGGASPLIPATYAQLASWIRGSQIPEGDFGDALRVAFDIAVGVNFLATVLDGLAVCSQFPDPCGENDSLFIDGGYVDNPSLVMNIAQYQRAGGSPDKPVKIVLTNTNEGKFDPTPELLPYFSNDENRNVEPGGFIWGDFLSQMSQQIFDLPMTTQRLLDLEKPAFGEGTFSTVELKGLQTVNNPAYGVEAGFTVDLLIINTNAAISTLIVGSLQIKRYTPVLAKMAKDLASQPTLLGRVKAFFDL